MELCGLLHHLVNINLSEFLIKFISISIIDDLSNTKQTSHIDSSSQKNVIS